MSKRPGYSSRHSVTPGQEGGKLREFQKGEEEREEEAYFVRANLLDVGKNVIKKCHSLGISIRLLQETPKESGKEKTFLGFLS